MRSVRRAAALRRAARIAASFFAGHLAVSVWQLAVLAQERDAFGFIAVAFQGLSVDAVSLSIMADMAFEFLPFEWIAVLCADLAILGLLAVAGRRLSRLAIQRVRI